jgi:hypothetical protein
VTEVERTQADDGRVELFPRIPLFAECTKAEMIEVAISADERETPAGDRLTEEVGAAGEFFVLVEGTVAVRRGGAAGRAPSRRLRSPSSRTGRARER